MQREISIVLNHIMYEGSGLMSELTVYIGNKLHSIRSQQSLSLEEVAFLASINTAHLSQIERGIGNPTVETLYKICQSLNYSLKDLFNDVPETKKEFPKTEITDKILIQIAQFTPTQQKELLNIINSCKKITKNVK